MTPSRTPKPFPAVEPTSGVHAKPERWRKPVTRGDCVDGPRPCQWSCRYRLEGAESCALDVADRGVHSDKEVAALMGISRQRVNQLEQQALRRLEFRARYLKGGGA